MNVFEELVEKYSVFYRPKMKGGRASSRASVKPLKIAFDVLTHPDNAQYSDEELKIAIAAHISKFLNQCRRNTAEGFALLQSGEERAAIKVFADFFVDDFFRVKNYGRRDLFAGNKAATYLHSCEFIVAGKTVDSYG